MDDTADQNEELNASATPSVSESDSTHFEESDAAVKAADSSAKKEADTESTSADGKKKKHHVRRIIVIIVVVVVVLILAVLAFFIYRGVLAPWNAAAKYNVVSYIYEDEVSDYIDNYRSQMGYGEDDVDETIWASFLAQYNLTPEILRDATIDQLIEDKLVYQQAEKLGISVSEEEVDEFVDASKDTYAFGDQDTWVETLAMYGQTEEGYREVVELELLRRALYSEEVEMPTPSDEEVDSYIASTIPTLDSNTVKHTYYFELTRDEGEDSYDNLKAVDEVKRLFLEGDKTVDAFNYLVASYSNNEELIETGGANGWSIDTSSYDTAYLQEIENLSAGDVSSTMSVDNGYGFIWVDETYTFPEDSEELETLTPADVPETLWSYLSDSEAYVLWQDDCQEYLASLYDKADVIIFDMPSDVPYNVDMSLAESASEESTGGETTEDSSAGEEASDEESESDDSSDEGNSDSDTEDTSSSEGKSGESG